MTKETLVKALDIDSAIDDLESFLGALKTTETVELGYGDDGQESWCETITEAGNIPTRMVKDSHERLIKKVETKIASLKREFAKL